MDTDKNSSESPRSRGHYDDEISLIDLALVLMRRKWWIAGVFLFCLLGGIVYWQMQTPERYYTTTMQIGTYPAVQGIKLVEEQRKIFSMLEEQRKIFSMLEEQRKIFSMLETQMVPMARQSLAEKNRLPESDIPWIKVKTGENNSLRLESRGQDLDPILVHDLHQMVVDSIVGRHDAILLEEMRSQLNSVKAKQDIVQLKIDHVDEYISFLNHQKEQFSQLLDLSKELEKESLEGNFIDPNLAMSLFVRGSLSADLLTQLNSIQKEVHANMQVRAELLLEMEQNQLVIEKTEHDISRLMDKGGDVSGQFVPTRASSLAVTEQEITTGGRMILALSIVLGLMLGIFSAFFVEFAAKVRETVRKQ